MPNDTTPHSGMSLFTDQGERKYLSRNEDKRFLQSLSLLDDPKEQTFCETLYWTGCRISEALQLDVMRVNIEDAFVVIRSLKKHGENKGKEFRIVPVPRQFAKRLNRVHCIVKTQRNRYANQFRRLWLFGRQKGWKLIKFVMDRAEIFGIRATARGLRHTFGVATVLSGAPLTQLQTWLGHSSLKTTSIYLTIIGVEDRSLAERVWAYRTK